MSLLENEKCIQILSILNDTNQNIDEKKFKIDRIITNKISNENIYKLHQSLNSLIGITLPVLNLPTEILSAFEPSQIGTIIGTIMDACIPQLDKIIDDSTLIEHMGLHKHEGLLGDREGYPDYKMDSGFRLELKLLYVDPVNVVMKKPPTPRESSARLTQKVTYKNVDPSKDVLLVIAYQLNESQPNIYSPKIIGVGLFPVIECIIARDLRLSNGGGRWFGLFETPAVLSKLGKIKCKKNESLNYNEYGRKESEGFDFNEDTNFGKLARIPYKELQNFINSYGLVEKIE